MIHSFSSARLSILEANSQLDRIDRESIYHSIIHILTPEVVSQLPPYFSDINTPVLAQIWFERMLKESQLFLVYQCDKQKLIGFSFLFLDDSNTKTKDAHLGYLLAKETWGQGFASELIEAFIKHCQENNIADRLIAGVDETNLASIALLKKVGFRQTNHNETNTLTFHLELTTLT